MCENSGEEQEEQIISVSQEKHSPKTRNSYVCSYSCCLMNKILVRSSFAALFINFMLQNDWRRAASPGISESCVFGQKNQNDKIFALLNKTKFGEELAIGGNRMIIRDRQIYTK